MLTTFKGTGFPDRGKKKFPWKKFLVIPKTGIFSFEMPFKGENPCIQGDFEEGKGKNEKKKMKGNEL